MPVEANEAVCGQAMRFDPTLCPPGYLYEQLADHLESLIVAGVLRPNTPLPAERRLAEEHGVSLGTARLATDLLRRRGLVVTIRSKGTYVTTSPSAETDIDDEVTVRPTTEESQSDQSLPERSQEVRVSRGSWAGIDLG